MPAVAQTDIDMQDLNVPASRIPRWYAAEQAEANYLAAQSWPAYDVSCECAGDSCGVDDPGAGCSPAAGTIALRSSWGCMPNAPSPSTQHT